MKKDRLILGTRKGLIILQESESGWRQTQATFPGIPISYAMEDHSHHTYRRHHNTFTRRKYLNLIVDDHSSNQYSLLHWLKRQIQCINPVNNIRFNPNNPFIS